MNKKHSAKLATAVEKVKLILNDARDRHDEPAARDIVTALDLLRGIVQSPTLSKAQGEHADSNRPD